MRSISAVSICFVRGHGTYSWMRMSRVTYEWVMSHVKESRWHKKHTSMSLVCDCFDASRMWLLCGERWHTWRSHVTYEWVMPHVKLSRYYATSPSISLVCICFVGNEGTYEGVVSYVNESCDKWRSHATMRRVRRVLSFVNAVWAVMAHMKESCHLWMRRIVSEGVVSCMDASHGMRRIVSEEVMLLWETGTSICRVSLLCREPWHIWRSHCIHEWTRPYMNESEESLHTWMNKACKRVILLYDEHIHLYHLWLLWHIEVAAKLLDSFLRSNKSTINLYHGTHEGVVSCMNEWYRKWRSHATMRRVYWPLSFVTALWGVMAHMKGTYHI